MIDRSKQEEDQRRKEKISQKVRAKIDPNRYEYYPAQKAADFYDVGVHQRVAIYARVSTDSVDQYNSFALQKKYYEDFVHRHSNWTLVKIYADQGISGTSLAHRDAFNHMLADCKAGKIDLILTKSVSRFARNVVLCISLVRELAEHSPPIGVFFESEAIFSLNDDSQLALSFLATMAEEESHTRSRSMESSLRMRLDNGIPLTPKLLGYSHDANKRLVINPEEAPTVKLAFYMYLYGYTTQQIADAFIALGRRSYLGNIKWTSNSIVDILRNERHCGDVLTRKTYTPDFRTHLAKKNRGQRPQSRYFDHHEAIVSRDDFNAVQRMLDNAKYRNRALLPELRVIDQGLLKGFVVINPRWASFEAQEYLEAAQGVCEPCTEEALPQTCRDAAEMSMFDFRGFEVARSELFAPWHHPLVTFSERKIRFNAACVRRLGERTCGELLVHPMERRFAIRPVSEQNRDAVRISVLRNHVCRAREIPAAAFFATLFHLFDWDMTKKYRDLGTFYESGQEIACVFDAEDAEILLSSGDWQQTKGTEPLHPITAERGRVRAVPASWTDCFGKPFYDHAQALDALERQNETRWQLRLEGRLLETGKKRKVTDFCELRAFIQQALSAAGLEDERHA